MSLSRRVLSGVLTVLAIAAIAFVVRGAVGGGEEEIALPQGAAVRAGTAAEFSLRAAGRNVIPEDAATIATARRGTVRVYADPASTRSKPLRTRVFNGQKIPLTFLVRYRRPGWVKVDLPTRPNRSRGWIKRSALDLSFTRLRAVVRAKAHKLALYDGERLVLSTRIAVGKALSPTPPGRYFVTDIVRATDPRGFYGPYSLGLSAHSDVYTSFEGGNGQVGIHGTNRPAAIGTDVSHGCVRVTNAVIKRLARIVPLGTPVTIRR